jgi:hypothetical protein
MCVITGIAAMVMPAVSPANAATPRDGNCQVGEFCLYYFYIGGGAGSVSDFNGSISNYGATQPTCYEFRGPGAGQGQCVWHKARSAWNRTTAHRVIVWNGTGYTGGAQTFLPGVRADLAGGLADQNESHRFIRM